MIRKLLLTFAVVLASCVSASAQNTQCANKPLSDDSNACANTRFVQDAISAIPPPAPTPPGGTTGQVQYNNGGVFGGFTASGDFTINTATGVGTLATVNSNTGSFGSATSCIAFTTNGKGLITAASQTTCTPAIGSVTGLGTGVATALAIAVDTTGSFSRLIANGAFALNTTAIASATCSTAQTQAATGVAATDNIIANFNTDPTATTGYIPSTNGMLTIFVYPSINTVNFKVCNNTGTSITPGAITLNWRVIR